MGIRRDSKYRGPTSAFSTSKDSCGCGTYPSGYASLLFLIKVIGIQSVSVAIFTPGSAVTRSSILRRIRFASSLLYPAICSPTDAVRMWSCSNPGFAPARFLSVRRNTAEQPPVACAAGDACRLRLQHLIGRRVRRTPGGKRPAKHAGQQGRNRNPDHDPIVHVPVEDERIRIRRKEPCEC